MTTEPQHTADSVDMSWAVNKLTQEKGVVSALLFSSDGLVLAASDNLAREAAERAAAAFAGVKSLQADLAAFCGAAEENLPLRHVVTDLKTRTVLLFAAGERTGVGVSVEGDSTGQEAAVAITATLKMINGLRPVLEARERTTAP
ncbi:roadblock/LC7 domain-containing protein [Streptomyces aidingensis]|uniref:Roadblock/LC7 domain-containing protein n=1 Tax=Streptomyces aidingensis TaxID=910347 RepID=A0A1I1KN98_9ACTN|nr:roadblock/LC7 domain-containing protein [Streptomyces aidingensis]SFC62247.1 Roadblock/LC7 domain-containing protein [Streptomyces aidingensis]